MKLSRQFTVFGSAVFCVVIFSLYLMLDRGHFDHPKSPRREGTFPKVSEAAAGARGGGEGGGAATGPPRLFPFPRRGVPERRGAARPLRAGGEVRRLPGRRGGGRAVPPRGGAAAGVGLRREAGAAHPSGTGASGGGASPWAGRAGVALWVHRPAALRGTGAGGAQGFNSALWKLVLRTGGSWRGKSGTRG